MSHLRITQLDPDSTTIDFGIGQPGFDLLPLDLIREAAALRLAEGDTTLLNYGYEQGDGSFLQALAGFLQPRYGFEVSPATLMTTTGASQALDLICTHFARPGDTVFVEEPTYFLALRIFAERRLNVVCVPTGEQGLQLDALEALLKKHQPAFLYTVPTFQNPSGFTTSAAHRRQLVELAQEHDFFIVADEVYHLLSYAQEPPAPLAQGAGSGRVLSLGSFSKILAPGLRLGWIQAAPALLRRLTGSGLLDSSGGLNPFTSGVARVIIEEGWLDAHVAQLKDIYRRRVACMASALAHHLGPSVRYATPNGGFFFWVALPEGTDARELLPRARQREVSFRPGANFSGTGGCRHYMRLSFTFFDEEKIERGIARLAEVIDT